MEIPEGAKPSVFESRFILEKGGKRQFTLDNPTGQYMDVCRIAYDTEGKGYEPHLTIFSMMSLDTWEDIIDSVLSDKGYVSAGCPSDRRERTTVTSTLSMKYTITVWSMVMAFMP